MSALSCWSVVGGRRSGTLVRYRQRTLSKASGPPAWWCSWVCPLRLTSDGCSVCNRAVTAGSQNGCGVEKSCGNVEEMHAVLAAAQVGACGVVWSGVKVGWPAVCRARGRRPYWWLGRCPEYDGLGAGLRTSIPSLWCGTRVHRWSAFAGRAGCCSDLPCGRAASRSVGKGVQWSGRVL